VCVRVLLCSCLCISAPCRALCALDNANLALIRSTVFPIALHLHRTSQTFQLSPLARSCCTIILDAFVSQSPSHDTEVMARRMQNVCVCGMGQGSTHAHIRSHTLTHTHAHTRTHMNTHTLTHQHVHTQA